MINESLAMYENLYDIFIVIVISRIVIVIVIAL